MSKPKQKFYQLTNSNKTEYYSPLIVCGEILLMKTMKRKSYALYYTLNEAKFFKNWLLKSHNIYSMITTK